MTQRFYLHLLTALYLAVLAGCSSDSTGPSARNAVALAVGGRHACHSDDTGTRCWGAGTSGQLGIGRAPENAAPTELAGTPVFVELVAGTNHTCGLDAEGAAFCWGSNADGQLGTASELEQCPLPCATSPTSVAGGLRFRTIAAGTRHTCGVATDGAAYCWGLNDVGQLGTVAAGESCVDGPCSRTPIPVQTTHSFTKVTAGNFHSCALEVSGNAFCWGFQIGNSDPLHSRHAQFQPEVRATPGNLVFRQISAGGVHTCGVTSSREGYCWGIDAIGAGPSPLESNVPVKVGGSHRFSAIFSGGRTSCGVEDDGTAFCWGPNSDGELGTEPIGSTIRFDLPNPISGGLLFTHLAPGHGTYCGITRSETIACWGRGTSGELGSGVEDSSTPVSVNLSP